MKDKGVTRKTAETFAIDLASVVNLKRSMYAGVRFEFEGSGLQRVFFHAKSTGLPPVRLPNGDTGEGERTSLNSPHLREISPT